MSKFYRLMALVIAMGATAPVLAESSMAVVDLPRAIFATELAKARVKQRSSGSEYVALQAKYESITADLKAMQKDIESKRATWSQEDSAEAQKKLEYLMADRELAARKLKAEQQALQGSIANEIQPKLGEALKELLEEEKVDLLLNAEAVIIAKPDLDLTAKLTERLNKKTQ